MPVLPWWFLAVFVLGVNFVIWGSVGAIRLTESRAGRLSRHRKQAAPARNDATGASKGSLTVSQVAVLMPAHNESAVLAASLDAIMKLVPASNIHVVSDGSTDDTPDIARRAGVQVYETRSNVGKAGALQEAIGHFQLIRRYPVVLLLDADTRVDPDYFAEALPLFNEPEVVAVAGCVRTARDRRLSLAGNVLVGHRERIYAIGQRALKFGQTYLRANATHIVPGFASMYRTSVLPNMEMNPPGLVIEDFNMTFEVYQKRLGKVAFTLKAVAETQDPDTLPDYIRQTRRWAIGLWQTVRRHPPRANLFTAMLAVLLLELITSSAIFLMLPMLMLVLVLPDLAHSTLHWLPFADVHAVVAAHMKLSAVLFGVALPDYALTCLVAVLERRPRLLLVGFFFPFLRIIDAAIGLCAIPAGWLVRSNGTWKSPARRAIDGAPEPVAIPAGQAEPVVPDAERTRVGAESAESPSASPVFANFVPEKTHAHG
ncbi:MAG TPA: glycosyltransferase family 2 protein [Streptosporangiaceae bacterium]|jgi:biofilm PGA synthesis N-glycosyltransferase PgaC|nr:glycosyltransferase family 2 protein [Streptosporangiaceae bacterium]